MNVLRYTGYTMVAAAALTAAAVKFYPGSRFTSYSTALLAAGALALLAVAAVSLYRRDSLTMHDKNILMGAAMVAVLLPTLYTAGAFVHESSTSWSSGEIHWHADFEVVVEDTPANLGFEPSESYDPPRQRCKKTGDRYLCHLDLVDPENYCQDSKEPGYMCRVNDRVGLTEYHEHNDKRIHLEGTFKSREEATLSAFFEGFNGSLTSREMVLPTNHGVYRTREGDNRTLKVAVKKGVGGDRSWEFVEPEDYVISPYTRGELLDDIFIIYDSRPENQVLQDLREDDRYRGLGFFKKGEGYSG